MVQRSSSDPAGSVQLAQASMGFGSVKSLKGSPMEIEKKWHKARGFVSSVLMEDISRPVVPKKPSSVRYKAVLKTIIPCYTLTLMSKWKEDVPQTLASMVSLGTQEIGSR